MTIETKKTEKRKECFVIMPISDIEPYPQGHFKRVYDHLIKPACENAGFTPLKADDTQKTNIIMVDILHKILTTEMVLCDLSSRNPNVLYELGIRQAFNLPVTLIKDSKTSRVFDIQGIRDIEYDENLRIDLVEGKINEIAQTIKNTYEAKDKELKSLIQVLNVKPPELTGELKISQETALVLDQLKSINSKINELERKTEMAYRPFATSGFTAIPPIPPTITFIPSSILSSSLLGGDSSASSSVAKKDFTTISNENNEQEKHKKK